ncbi:Protein of uncharacterised function (DUF2580) [Mycobacteroides abscessus subsp. abscessus]|uniref:type VII secretion target n=1 Tax=Mycobacteroides abscessus TaxID=36809 RepID=UPI0009279E7A|nr:type VII secretion target [Mycobacteroides abscessus]SIC62415.1 Protein of uncharacterised function (DUF2580) [Mycobacteroides abscessus subsp. abscessus]SIC94052.1 Protein of uncharacterised function (DUF2580) [Mycobacteroides abscessus subsp. abscessus]SID51650.1 Protein of uncharacterised function (DUF2580) [Mycobacteroides abscessus subsp. abscessus]SKV98901.1 Protein of uncharacterised function (DUF2580) [Mycobacteroides abscessus subsp. abscessus]SKW04448.1 Protein of uncharacterised 
MVHLDVDPADLTRIAERYRDLGTQMAALPTQAITHAQQVIDTHGIMGYPVAVGITAAMAKTETPLTTKATAFTTSHATRLDEHATTYTTQDTHGAHTIAAAAAGPVDPRPPRPAECDSLRSPNDGNITSSGPLPPGTPPPPAGTRRPGDWNPGEPPPPGWTPPRPIPPERATLTERCYDPWAPPI